MKPTLHLDLHLSELEGDFGIIARNMARTITTLSCSFIIRKSCVNFSRPAELQEELQENASDSSATRASSTSGEVMVQKAQR